MDSLLSLREAARTPTPDAVLATSAKVLVNIDMQSADGVAWVDAVGRNIAIAAEPAVCVGMRVVADYFDTYEGFAESTVAQYAQIGGAARHESGLAYGGGGGRIIQFSLKLWADGAGSPESASREQVIEPARWLEALRYPFYTDARIPRPPPPVIVSIGSALRVRGRVTSVVAHFLGPFNNDGSPSGADINISIVTSARVVGNSTARAERNQRVV